MGTIARGAKAGGGTDFNTGQIIDPAEVNTDLNTAYTVINANLDNDNIKAAAGIVFTKLTHSGARVFNSASLGVASNTITTLTFDTERYDTDAYHSTVTNTGRLTAPTTGKYLIMGHARFAALTTYERIGLQIRVNGVTVIASNITALATPANYTQDYSISAVYLLAATDYVELIAFQRNTAASAQDVSAVANLSPEFSITLLGA